MSDSRELPLDRLATTDERGRRVYLYPAEVRGRYRSLRKVVSAALLNVFLFLPWIRIGGHQSILLDIPHRRFSILGLTFWAHDAPMLVFVLGGAALGLSLVTAIWGRVWCGWACPQTVFVVSVFRRIEGWIEGDSVSRRRLDQAPMSARKLGKKSLKWLLFTLVSAIIGHSFLAYFVGTGPLLEMVRSSPAESPYAFLVMAIVTLGVLFDFGWFREQFCTIVCPYGRFQSVLMDDRSLVVAYDTARGEPRRGVAAPGEKQGDCVNCYRCVQVCPTGIDIRRGLQLECVACTACIDACDDVMSRLGKPRGLIRYDRASRETGARARIYAAALAVFALGLFFTVRGRKPVEAELVRAIEAPYQEITLSGGGAQVVNHFKMDLRNRTFDDLPVSVDVPSEVKAQGVSVVVSNHQAVLAGGTSERADLFVTFPKTILSMGKATIRLVVSSPVFSDEEEVRLVGPLR